MDADLATRDAAIAAALYFALVAAWPLAMLGDVGLDAWRLRIGQRGMVSRFAGPLHYVMKLPERLAPWTLLLPALALAWRSLLRGATGAALRFPVTWFGVIFALLHVTSAKHSRYLLPALPALALALVALWIEAPTGALAALAPRIRRWRDGALATVLGLAALAGAAGPVALWLRPTSRALWPALLLGGALTVWVSIAGLRLWRARGDAVAVLACAVVAVLGVEAGIDVVRSGDFLADDDFGAARRALAQAASAAPLLTVDIGGDPRNALLFATGRPAQEGGSIEDAKRFAQQAGGGLVVARAATFDALRADPGLVVGETRPLRLAGRSLAFATLGARDAAPR